ncbi:MAG TPA: hypothetical protein VI670_10775 [Thermoanaerobaculia bacterium]|jgi:hypothetical protein
MARFSPPGRLTDLTTAAQLDGWSDIVNRGLDGAIASLTAAVGAPNVQLVNPLRTTIPNPQRRLIPWLTFPELVYDFNPLAAARRIVEGDTTRNSRDEYSEWFTHTSGGNVVAVDITTELPEYWEYLATALTHAEFTDIYRRHANPAATEAALFPPAGRPTDRYDPANRFNTTEGAMHMICSINNLGAALGLIWQAIIWRLSGSEPKDVQDCEPGGQHHADPTVIAHFNRMAREGRFITLEDPVGVYILGVDTAGWKTPDGSDPRSLITVTRGNPPVRLRVHVPSGAFTLSDVTIGGEPIRSGAQVAERVTVGIYASVGAAGAIRPTAGEPCRAVPPPPPPPPMPMAAVESTEIAITWTLGRKA